MATLQLIRCQQCGGIEAVPRETLSGESNSTELTVVIRGNWCASYLDALFGAGSSVTAAGA